MVKANPKLIARLSRIEGQIRGLTAMLKEGRYCLEIVAQIRAARAALARVEQVMIAEHLSHCVERAIGSGDPKEQRKKMTELVELLGRTDR